MNLNTEVRDLIRQWGADFFGVADLSPARETIREQGGAEVARYPLAVSIGIILPHAIVDRLPRRAERAVAVSYRHHAYDIINLRLDLAASHVSGFLQREGGEALPIPASKRVDDERISGAFSHKLAAHLAGLGWIGKSCMLITPEAGPRVRWATVLTDVPLTVTGEPMDERCRECSDCVEACPVGAFTGRPFRAGEPREARYDAGKCDRYFTRMVDEGAPRVCGMCLYICPHGKKSARDESP